MSQPAANFGSTFSYYSSSEITRSQGSSPSVTSSIQLLYNHFLPCLTYTQRHLATFWSDNLAVLVDAGAEMRWMGVLSHFTRTCESTQEKEKSLP